MHFPCDSCGICCKHIGQIPQLAHFDNGKGQCVHLNENNQCTIYEQRPEICNVAFMYEKHYKTQYSKEEFYALNIQICEMLKEKEKNNNNV